MLSYNIRLSIRYFLKNRLYSSIIIGGFALGFAACILIGLFWFAEHNVNKSFPEHTQIYRLYDKKNNTCNINYDLADDLKSNFAEIITACPMDYFTGMEFYLQDEESKTSAVVNHIISTDNSFSDLFSLHVVESLSPNLFEGLQSFVVTKSLAQKLYKNQSAIGKTLVLGNPYIQFRGTITAVIEDLPENASFKAEILMNIANKDFRLSTTCDNGKCRNLSNHFIQVRKDTDPDIFATYLNKKVNLEKYVIGGFGLQRLDDIYLTSLSFKDLHNKGSAKLLSIFLAVALLILFLSSINYLNYSVSMQYSKLRVIGISQTNGASRKQLMSFSFTEVSMSIMVAVLLSFMLVILLLPFSEVLFGRGLKVDLSALFQMMPIMTIIIVALILLNSLVPFYFLTRFKITDFMSGTNKRKGKQLAKQVLLTFQLAVSMVLIILVLGIFKQLFFIKQSDLGFDKELLLRIDVPDLNSQKEAFRQEIEKLPFVASSAYSDGCPGRILLRMGSNTGENDFTVNCITIGDDYLKTMGIDLKEGREFQKGDNNNVCLLNETALMRYAFESIEGKKFNNGKEGGYEIIGITNDFHISPFYNSIEPVALIYNPDVAAGMLSIRLLPGDIRQNLEQIKQVWKKFLPYEVMNYAFYDQQFQLMYNKEEKLAQSIAFFSIIAIILTCMGILSQIIISSLTRTKEIGVRKVNGARVSEILIMLNKDFVKWTTVAFVIATPIGWFALSKWLQNFAYKTGTNWWLFAGAGVITLMIAMLTVSWQSWRAATKNPVEALRYE